MVVGESVSTIIGLVVFLAIVVVLAGEDQRRHLDGHVEPRHRLVLLGVAA
jgi:flagellin-like protein